jgi:phage FluMu gp28-like protein
MPPEIRTDRDTLTRFVAGLDIGGRFMNPERDPTVLCICRLRTPDGGQYLMPNIEIIKFISWQAPWDRILDDVSEWEHVIGFQKVCVDATGIGHHAAGQLSYALGSWCVDEVTFTAQTKSELCYELRDAVDSGRVKMFKGDSPHANEFWSEARKARVQLRQGSVLMGFGVPDHLGHDDYLVALALAVHAAHTTPSRFAYAYRRGDIL